MLFFSPRMNLILVYFGVCNCFPLGSLEFVLRVFIYVLIDISCAFLKNQMFSIPSKRLKN